MNKKQDMVEKDSFRQAGEDLLRKVREEERADLRLALSSWQKLEERLNAPRKTSVLRIRYLVSSVAAAVMLLLAVGCYFWMMGHDKSSLPLALLEEKNVGALPGDEIVLVKDQGWVQLKDEATVIYDTVGKSNVEEHQIEKNEQETKIDEPDQIIVPKGRRANIVFSDGEFRSMISTAVEFPLGSHRQPVRSVGKIGGRDTQSGNVVSTSRCSGKLGITSHRHPTTDDEVYLLFEGHGTDYFVDIIGTQSD